MEEVNAKFENSPREFIGRFLKCLSTCSNAYARKRRTRSRSVNIFKPFATFFVLTSHFQSRNNITDWPLTSSVSYSRPGYYTAAESKFRNLCVGSIHLVSFIDRPSFLANSLLCADANQNKLASVVGGDRQKC